MHSTYLQADRSRIDIEVDDYELIDPWDSTVFVTMPLDGRSPDALRRRELHITHRGNYDDVIADLGAEIFHRLQSQRGQFLAAAPRGRGAGVALWRGRHHEVAVPIPSNAGARDPAAALRPLMGLDFDDRADGLTITPHPRLNATLSVLDAYNYVPGVGEIGVLAATEGLGNVPSWAGARVPEGEIWRIDQTDDQSDPGGPFLLFASRTAIMTITPEPPDPRDPAATRRRQQRHPLQPALDFTQRVRRFTLGR
jgi:hypothetical protein